FARLPCQKMSLRHFHSFRQHHSAKTWLAVLSFQSAAGAAWIHLDERMMNHLRIYRLKLDRSDVSVRPSPNGDGKIAINIFALGLEVVGLRHLNNQIRLAKIPAARPFGRGWQV